MSTTRIHLTDENGSPVTDARYATNAEIVELADDGTTELGRTYMERHPDDDGSRDAPPRLADDDTGTLVHDEVTAEESFKNVWDVYLSEDGTFTLVTTLEQYLKALELDRLEPADQVRALATVVVTPAFAAAPEELRTAVFGFIDANAPAAATDRPAVRPNQT